MMNEFVSAGHYWFGVSSAIVFLVTVLCILIERGFGEVLAVKYDLYYTEVINEQGVSCRLWNMQLIKSSKIMYRR